MIILLHKLLSITGPFFRFRPLSRRTTTGISIPSIDSNNLSIRFKRILDFIPTNCSIADIGADHGILTTALTKHIINNKNNKIIYIDPSRPAVTKAVEYFKKNSVRSKIQVEIGSGMEPLLRKNMKCECIVIAGMGSNTISKIINQRVDEVNETVFTLNQSSSSLSLLALDEIGVQQIIIQPYPPNLLPMLIMIQQIMDHGWVAENQHIDQIGKYFYITTSFIRQKHNTGTPTVSSWVSTSNYASKTKSFAVTSSIQTFESMPLTQRYCQQATTITNSSDRDTAQQPRERNVWKAYLHKYLINTTPDNHDQLQTKQQQQKLQNVFPHQNNIKRSDAVSNLSVNVPASDDLHRAIANHITMLI